MKKIIFIFCVIGLLLTILFIYTKKNIQDNISGEITNVTINNIKGLLPTLIDLKVVFKVVNNSKFTLKLKDFNIKIIDVLTNTLVTESKVIQTLVLNKGETESSLILNDLQLLGNANNLLNDNSNLLAIISFSFYGIKVEFEQEINL